MAEWVWEARARSGETRTGVMEADSADVVQGKLKAQALNPIKVKRKGRELKLPQFGTGVTDKDVVIFIRQFATMIDAGLPLVQCLDILSAQGENVRFNKVLKDIKAHVEQGATFSDALAKHPKIFDSLFCNLIHAGEMGGILDTILNRLAIYIEKRVKLQRQVKGAMGYPVTVMGIAGGVMTVLLIWVIPTFETMFAEMKGELPALTAWMIKLSRNFTSYFPFIAAAAVGVYIGIKWSVNNPKTLLYWHIMVLRMPILGNVMRKISVARFTRTLGTLLSSGVPILDALQVCAKASGNMVVERAINFAADRIREGRTMAEPLLESGVFPPMVVQMIGVGEQTGALDQMLNKIADFYEEEVDVAVASMMSMMEPLMMVFIGGMVGTMMIAMYMPIFSMAGNVSTD